jgi:hypothetical protein
MTSIATQAGPFQDEINQRIMFTFNANYNLNVSFDGRKLEITQIIWILNSTEMKCKGPNVEDALHGTHSC